MRSHVIVSLVAVVAACCAAFSPALSRAAESPSTRSSSSTGAGEGGGPGSPVIAVFKLTGPVLESPSQDLFSFGEQHVQLRDLVRRMRQAAEDENVKAVVVLDERAHLGPAQTEEIRQAIARVRGKGKDVYVHADVMMPGQFLLASSASRISVVPSGDLLVLGLHGETPYLRGLLDKIGVKPDFLHIGAYKSASEIFMREGPSPEAEAMYNWLFDSLYASQVDLIANGRKADADKVKQWIDKGLYTAEEAKAAGLIDAVEHRQDFDSVLKKKYGQDLTFERRYGVEKQQQIDFSNPFAMFKILGEMFGGQKKEAEPGKPAVGIVYVDGMITTGSKEPSIFGAGGAHSSDIRKALDQAARDDSIKAVVLRIDSPGGSATASEIILDATKRVRQVKPLVVSMGNVAGSGGYYVALGSGTIFADATTLTASIGVVTGKVATNDMWKKLGITFKSYNRGKSATLFATDSTFTDEERQQVQGFMQSVYDVFKQHVMEARGQKLKKPLDELAGGRVYTGKQALDLGLIDRIGTLQDAIEFAAKEGKLVGDYDVRVVPQPKSPIEELLERSSGGGDEEGRRWITADGPAGGPAGGSAGGSAGGPAGGSAGSGLRPNPLGANLVDLAAPYLTGLDPARAAAVRSCLMKLQLLAQDRVILAMPETYVFN